MQENIPPDSKIEAKRAEIYQCFIAGTIPNTAPKIPPDIAPHLNPYFMVSHCIYIRYLNISWFSFLISFLLLTGILVNLILLTKVA